MAIAAKNKMRRVTFMFVTPSPHDIADRFHGVEWLGRRS
jgi:hypothetical protein